MTLASDGNFTYVPVRIFPGKISLPIKYATTSNRALCDQATVTINVSAASMCYNTQGILP